MNCDSLQPLPNVVSLRAERDADLPDKIRIAVDHEFPTSGWTGPVYARVESGDAGTLVFQGFAAPSEMFLQVITPGSTEFFARSAEAVRVVVKYGEGEEKIAEIAPAPELPSIIGKKLRVLRPGEVGTTDYDENRVTIHVDDNEVILSRIFG